MIPSGSPRGILERLAIKREAWTLSTGELARDSADCWRMEYVVAYWSPDRPYHRYAKRGDDLTLLQEDNSDVGRWFFPADPIFARPGRRRPETISLLNITRKKRHDEIN
jgi:hypothetical protein